MLLVLSHPSTATNSTATLSRVSLTYRVKSAHKVKLTDNQLLQWMVPILLVMLIYLGTWTLSATPSAEVVSLIKCLFGIYYYNFFCVFNV